MPLACLYVDDSPVITDFHGLATVTLLRGHELDPAVAEPMVVPSDKRRPPLASGLLAGEWTAWVVGLVFRRPEQ